ncbi:hypothetical protein HAX54_050635 [Datura stramonium]|uniref:DUF4219 domain-containing protein n=1 Tax=Datura stramonium TaxID=4076 RepID=A0ABS8SXM7_DATST|nr:hypothetical protein [Datura stramonium]
MTSEITLLEGQSNTRPPLFNGQHYSHWKNQMEIYMKAEDYQLWFITLKGPLVPTKVKPDGSKNYELKKIDKVVKEPKKEHSLSLKAESESDDEEMTMFVRRFKKFFRKENSEKREFHNKEEQRKNSKKQQQLVSKSFKKVMKATWGGTSDEESEGEDVENDNLALMARSDSNSDSESSEAEVRGSNKK